jgi:NADH dehydrogenase FAD-containing subunit
VDNKEYFENTPGLAQYLIHRNHDNDSSEIHFAHTTHLANASQLVCGDVAEVTNEEVVIVRNSKSKGKETARLRYDCLVISSGRRYRPVDVEDRSLANRLKYISSQREIIKRSETLLVVGGDIFLLEVVVE